LEGGAFAPAVAAADKAPVMVRPPLPPAADGLRQQLQRRHRRPVAMVAAVDV
jgi:hypothetical protein